MHTKRNNIRGLKKNIIIVQIHVELEVRKKEVV